jgi:hypothetical protein
LIIKSGGEEICSIGLAAALALALLRRWRVLAMLAAVTASLVAVVANSRFWVLPASFVLYPDRATCWAPLVAVGAIAWAARAAWKDILSRAPGIAWGRAIAAGAVVALCALGAARHAHLFQRKVVRPAITEDEWAALQWSKRSLAPGVDAVAGKYWTGASYLPAVAGIATDAWHVHVAIDGGLPAPRINHVWQAADDPPAAGTVVFQNGRVRIVRLDGTGSGTAALSQQPSDAPR